MNGTDTVPIISQLPNINLSDNSTVTKFEYPHTHSSASVVYYRVNGSNHSVPGTEYHSNQDIYAYDVIWEFFKPRRLGDK